MCLAIWSNCDESINQFDRHCDQSINQFKTGHWGWSYFFQKRKKSLICICKWKGPFRFANKTKWTSVKMSRTISSIVHSSIQLFHRFKILLDKKKIVSYLEVFQQIVEINFIVNWHQTIFSSLSLHQTFNGWGGVLPSVVRTRKCRPPRAQKRHLVTNLCHVAKNVHGPLGFKKQDS